LGSTVLKKEPLATLLTLSNRFPTKAGCPAKVLNTTQDQTLSEVLQVTNRRIDNDQPPVVVMLDIEKSYAFPKDTAAKILTSGLLGDQYIGLEPGGDDANLAAGDTIAQTQSAVVLENLIGQFLTSRADTAGTGGTAASGAKP
jgi:ABC-type transporter Mla subunit MlaD